MMNAVAKHFWHQGLGHTSIAFCMMLENFINIRKENLAPKKLHSDFNCLLFPSSSSSFINFNLSPLAAYHAYSYPPLSTNLSSSSIVSSTSVHCLLISLPQLPYPLCLLTNDHFLLMSSHCPILVPLILLQLMCTPVSFATPTLFSTDSL